MKLLWQVEFDEMFYGMYAVKLRGDNNIKSDTTFHFILKDEALRLRDYLNSLELEMSDD